MFGTFKRGATLRGLLQFTDHEWETFWPWESLTADAKQGELVHPLAVAVDPESKTVLLSASTDGWPLAAGMVDLLIIRSGIKTYLPAASNFTFTIIEPVTEEAE